MQFRMEKPILPLPMSSKQRLAYIRSHVDDFSIKEYLGILGFSQQDRCLGENRFRQDVEKMLSEEGEESSIEEWAKEQIEDNYAVSYFIISLFSVLMENHRSYAAAKPRNIGKLRSLPARYRRLWWISSYRCITPSLRTLPKN